MQGTYFTLLPKDAKNDVLTRSVVMHAQRRCMSASPFAHSATSAVCVCPSHLQPPPHISWPLFRFWPPSPLSPSAPNLKPLSTHFYSPPAIADAFAGLGGGLVLSCIWMLVLRLFCGLMVWVTVWLANLCFIACTIFCYAKAGDISATSKLGQVSTSMCFAASHLARGCFLCYPIRQCL